MQLTTSDRSQTVANHNPPSRLVFCLLLALIGATAPIGAQPASTDELKQRVHELATEAINDSASVGLSVAVSVGSEMVVEAGYGAIELEHDVAANADSVFRIGSITKQFTAAAVMKLIEEGAEKDGKKLSLEAPMTDFVDFPTQGHVVTVRHLLTHTSGIKSYTGLGPEWMRTVPLEMTNDQLLDLVKEKDFDFEPNTEFRYNNSGYFLLGVLIEELSGKDYGDYVAESFFEPLGLTHLRYGSNSAIIRNRAQGYTKDGDDIVNDDLIGMSQPGAAGALISNAGDLVRWNRALVTGKVVTADSYRQMSTGHLLADGKDTGYGFGLGVGKLEEHTRISHGGGINGFNSMLSYFPERDLTIAVISNSESYSSGRLADAIARAALGEEITVKDLAIDAPEAERVSGDYAVAESPLAFKVLFREDKLMVEAAGQGETRLRLQGVSEDGSSEYRPDFDDAVRVVFAAGSPAPFLTLFQSGRSIEAPRTEP